jgi:S-formylglutathione hydrolase FrmB
MIVRHLASLLSSALFSLLLFFAPQAAPLRFEVTSQFAPASGRLFVVMGKKESPEPRSMIDEAGTEAVPVMARDVRDLGTGAVASIDRSAEIFPIRNLDELPPGDYYVQALFHSNTDLKSLDAPGTEYSEVRRVHVDPRQGATVRLELTKMVPPERLPPDDEYIKYVRIQSSFLTAFHKRPIYLRAAVVLPRDYGTELNRRYPLRIHIGGYGTRFTAVQRLMAPGSEFRRMWLAADTPRMIYLQLDGDGPFGDPYQVNSDNNGPYGDAITRELIPYIERTFRAVGQPIARMLDGQSTGGWVSLALKVFYPDYFNAVWSSCPDGVDLRGFQLINIYKDDNAYVDDRGMERASKRDLNGNVEFTIRRECQMENVIGLGSSWTMSGQQWGAWNAVYGPRGAEGRPVPLWDRRSGKINKSVVPHWEKYDLRLILEKNWRILGPKMKGKIHISVGESDNYFLNNAVHMLDDFLRRADPPADARIAYGPGRGHCWSSITEAQMMNEMAVAAGLR